MNILTALLSWATSVIVLVPGYFAHNGANVRFQGTFYGLTDDDEGVVVMTNWDNGLQIAEEVVHSVPNAYGRPVFQSQARNSISLSAATTKDVTGKAGVRQSQWFPTLRPNGWCRIRKRPVAADD